MKPKRSKSLQVRSRPAKSNVSSISWPRWLILCHLSSSLKLDPVIVGLAQNMREADKMARKYLRELPLARSLGLGSFPVKRETEFLEIMSRRLERPVARAEWILDRGFLPGDMKNESLWEFPRVRIEPYQPETSPPT